MSDVNLERIGRTLEMLDQWPSDGRPDRLPEREGEESWSRIVVFATGIGWIESVTTHKPCDRCGTPRRDHTFFRITNAGSSALQMAKALRAEFERRQGRVEVNVSIDAKPALAELEAAHGLIGLHVGVVNGITALYGDELEEYLTDRIGDAIDIPCHDDRKAARAVVASFEDDGWIVRRKVEE